MSDKQTIYDFACDQCGECCRQLIVEVDWIDAQREPKLYSLWPHAPDTLRENGKCIHLSWGRSTDACPFLASHDDGRTSCGIYPTRPTACVYVTAGDAKCQQARLSAGLPMLRDKYGRLPSRELLEQSLDDYGDCLDLDELYGDQDACG